MYRPWAGHWRAAGNSVGSWLDHSFGGQKWWVIPRVTKSWVAFIKTRFIAFFFFNILQEGNFVRISNGAVTYVFSQKLVDGLKIIIYLFLFFSDYFYFLNSIVKMISLSSSSSISPSSGIFRLLVMRRCGFLRTYFGFPFIFGRFGIKSSNDENALTIVTFIFSFSPLKMVRLLKLYQLYCEKWLY